MYLVRLEREGRLFVCLEKSDKMNRFFLGQCLDEIEMLMKENKNNRQIRFQTLAKLGYIKNKLDEFDRGEGGIERGISYEILSLRERIENLNKKIFHSAVSFGNNYSHHL